MPEKAPVSLLLGEAATEIDTEPIAVPVVEHSAPVHLMDRDTGCDADLAGLVGDLSVVREASELRDSGLAEQDVHGERVGTLFCGGVALLLRDRKSVV